MEIEGRKRTLAKIATSMLVVAHLSQGFPEFDLGWDWSGLVASAGQ
jgi:hypothetical protein